MRSAWVNRGLQHSVECVRSYAAAITSRSAASFLLPLFFHFLATAHGYKPRFWTMVEGAAEVARFDSGCPGPSDRLLRVIYQEDRGGHAEAIASGGRPAGG